jgi:hypothetical protein
MSWRTAVGQSEGCDANAAPAPSTARVFTPDRDPP